MKWLAAILVVLVMSETASACGRCGRGFGRSCAFAQKQVVVKSSYGYAYQQPQNVTNLSIVNAYPPGTSQLTVGQLAQSYQPNPDLAVTLSARIAENALQPLRASIEASQQAYSQSTELQRLALATEHLRMAMGAGQASTQASSLSLEVNQGSAMRTDVGAAAEGIAAASVSLLATKCASCHGLDKQAPKGGLYYDQGHSLDAQSSVAALRVIAGHDVPEQMRDVIQSLTAEERCQLLLEIASLSRR